MTIEELTNEQREVPQSVGRDAPLAPQPTNDVAERGLEVFDALRLDRSPALASYYLSAIQLLRGRNADRFPAAAHQLRELMEKWNAPVDDERRGLAERVDDLATQFREVRRSSQAAASDGWAGEIDDPLRAYLSASNAVFAWRAERHVPTRVAITTLLHEIQADVPGATLGPGVAAWIHLRNYFVAVAHHGRATDDEEFESALEAFDQLVLRILRPAKYTFTTMRTLEDVISEAEQTGVTDELMRRVAVVLARRDIQAEHFFGKATAAWVEPLRRAGYFKTPPAPVRSEQGMWFPFWPESRYLARVASIAPEAVTATFLAMEETENVHVHHDLIEAAMSMSARNAVQLASHETAWIKKQPHLFFLLPVETSKLVVRLLEHREVKAARRLADVLLDVLPPPARLPEQLGSAFGPRPRTRSEDYEFAEALKLVRQPLTDAAGIDALDLLIRKLRTYLDLWRGAEEKFDYSDMWFETIEGARHDTDAHELLASAVRDSADQLLRAEPTRLAAIAARLERAHWPIFQRIALYLLRVHGDSDPGLVARWISNPAVFGIRSAVREYRPLVRQRFAAVRADKRDDVVAAVVRLEEERMAAEFLDVSDAEVVAREHRTRLAFTLAPFSQFLKGEWKSRWDEVASAYRTEPERSRPRTGWVGPTSPYTTAELAAMDDAMLINALRTWVPTDPIMGPSREGLSRALDSVITDAPERFASLAPAFAQLDPAYVRALMSGLTTAVRKDAVFKWGPVLELSEAMYALPLEIVGRAADAADFDDDPHRGWLRADIARLLEAGLEARPGSLPIDERARIGRLLVSAVDDRSPGALVVEEGLRDWPTVAVNSPRGRAAHLLVEFAAWMSRELRSGGTARIDLARVAEFATLIQQVLKGARPEAHAALGMDFTRLAAIDMIWATANVDVLFPRTDAFLRSVAWEAYLLFSRPYDNVLPILHDLYVDALATIGTEPVTKSSTDPRERLMEHVLLFYLRGRIGMDGTPALATFYMKASADLRKRAMQFLGRLLDDEGAVIPAAAAARLRALVEWRLEIGRTDPVIAEELSAFGWLFRATTLDPIWSLQTATAVVHVAGQIEPVRLVIERAGALAEERPGEVLSLLDAIAASSSALGHVDPQTLERAITPALLDPNLRERAVETANVLGQRGFVGLRTLVSGADMDETARWLEASYRRRETSPTRNK